MWSRVPYDMQVNTIYGTFWGTGQCKIRYPAIKVHVIWGTPWHAGKCNPKVPCIMVCMNMSSEVPSDIKVSLFLGTFWVSDMKIHLLWGTSVRTNGQHTLRYLRTNGQHTLRYLLTCTYTLLYLQTLIACDILWLLLTGRQMGRVQPLYRGCSPKVTDSDVYPWGITGRVGSPVVH